MFWTMQNLQVELADIVKWRLLAFINEKLTKAPNEERSINQLYSKTMLMIDYDQTNEKK